MSSGNQGMLVFVYLTIAIYKPQDEVTVLSRFMTKASNRRKYKIDLEYISERYSLRIMSCLQEAIDKILWPT